MSSSAPPPTASPTLDAERQKAMGLPLLRLAFRPFYLGAALVATLAIPLWLASYYGWLTTFPNINMFWHMHEMVYGFAVPVIVGFLYTGGQAWTGLRTPHGWSLAAVFALWVAARLAMLLGNPMTAAIIDGAFLFIAAVPLYLVLKRANNKRNMFTVLILLLLAVANVLYHCAHNGLLSISPVLPIYAAIFVVVMLETLMGGRVIPSFTKNTLPSVTPIVNVTRDHITVTLIALASITWLVPVPRALTAVLCALAGISVLIRVLGWKPWRTVAVPLLWILHLSYSWIGVGFLLLSLAALGKVSTSAAFHALTIGSMAGLIIGMITRTALGHTGRPLKARPVEVVTYSLVHIGAITRLAAALVPAAAWHQTALLVAMSCWSVAFVFYLAVYGPYLSRPRIDGRDG
ncbi:MAG: NnrS family protein [Herbaspirillum sp.]